MRGLDLLTEQQHRFLHSDIFVLQYYKGSGIDNTPQRSLVGTRNMLLLVGLFYMLNHVYMDTVSSSGTLPPPKRREPNKANRPTEFHNKSSFLLILTVTYHFLLYILYFVVY